MIHTAFTHDFSDLAASCRADIRAIETIGDALAGSGRPFVVTSGMCFDAPGRPGTEADPGDPAAGWRLRVPSEVATLALAARGVRASVLRLPPSVHGRQLGVPVLGVSTEGAADHFGWFVHFFGSDKPTSSSRTRERLGWRPIQPGLIADVDRPSYFTT